MEGDRRQELRSLRIPLRLQRQQDRARVLSARHSGLLSPALQGVRHEDPVGGVLRGRADHRRWPPVRRERAHVEHGRRRGRAHRRLLQVPLRPGGEAREALPRDRRGRLRQAQGQARLEQVLHRLPQSAPVRGLHVQGSRCDGRGARRGRGGREGRQDGRAQGGASRARLGVPEGDDRELDMRAEDQGAGRPRRNRRARAARLRGDRPRRAVRAHARRGALGLQRQARRRNVQGRAHRAARAEADA